jgi:hypothetical protein
VFLAADPEVRVLFPALPDFLRCSESGTGSTEPCECNEDLLERKSSGSGLENRDYGSVTLTTWHLNPQKLALTSSTSGGLSVGRFNVINILHYLQGQRIEAKYKLKDKGTKNF